MNHQLLVAEFLSTPWALMPERLHAITSVLARWAGGTGISQDVMDQMRQDRQVRQARKTEARASSGAGIAVMPLYGVVTQRGNLLEDVSGSGCTSTQQFSAGLRELLADDSVGQILIDIDSPGGSVYGVSELADEIRAARDKKPVVAIANSLAASAAYWLGSAASEFYVTPGGEVGSIGVWQAHFDYSQAMANDGVKATLVSAGQYKVEANPYQPLDPEAHSFMQSRVDDYYQAFTKAIARGRDVPISQVRNGMGQGRVLGSDAAKSLCMVDDVATFDEVLQKMHRTARASVKGSSKRLTQARQTLALI